MKKIYLSFITVLLVALTAVSCQQDDELKGNVGYLRIEVGTNAYVDTRSVPEDYNPKQIALQILNSSNEVVEETDDWEELKGQQLRLTPGTYTIKASSNGFDGSESGFDIPYYAGSQQVTIESGKEETANITCTLANVKVTVNYDESFQKFASATTTVTSELEDVAALDFTMGKELKPGYFPVGNLNVTVKVTNQAGQSNQKTTEITEVKARKHYILNFKVAESGSINKPTVTIKGEEITYTFQFNVSTEAITQLEAASANAWSNFAYVEGSVLSAESELDPTAMRFEYKTADADEWTTVTAANEGGNYKATLTALAPATTYVYRMAYEKEEENYVSDEVSFTTEAATPLPNGNLDDWYMSGKTWYPVTENDYKVSGSFWDSSNPGTTTGAGALVNKNPTQGNSTTVALHGWFHYTSGKIDYRGGNTPEGLGEMGTDDLCSIYVALSKKQKQVDNTKTETFLDLENDADIIAYGQLADAEAVTTNGWKEFTLNFKYKTLDPQDSYYLIIVFSSSKYGDYFTGSTNSVMYVDDLELVYGEPVTE